MQASKFLENKIRRQLSMNGVEYTFTCMGEDEYHQPVEASEVSIIGIYHENNSFIKLQTTDAAELQRKKSPMILTIMDENSQTIKQGDTITIYGVKYKVASVSNIQNYGVALDISLEMEV